MTDLSNDSSALALSPPYIVDATPDVKSEDPNAGVPLLGVPLRLTGSGHLKVVVDPQSPAADSVPLHINGSATPIDAPVTVDPVTKRTTFEVSRALLRDGLQFFHYVAKRIGGGDEPSPNLWVLYSRNRPGGLDPINDDKDIHEGLGIDLPEDVKQNGVDLVAAERGVALTVSYAFPKLHDVVTVDCNGFAFNYTVTTGDLGGAFDIVLPKAAFVGGGNSLTFKIFYRLKDQLGNDTQNSLPSPTLSIKVDLTPKVELPTAPFVPALAGNVISPIKYTTGFVVRVDWAKGFKPGDKAKLVVKGGAAGAGSPKFTFVALNSNFRANFQLTTAFILANAGREVVFTWILLSGGVETESEPLTLTIESVNVTDPNFPKPEIVEAYGTNAVDLRAFTGDAHIVCAPWPFIGLLQQIWVHVLGTGIDGSPKTVAIAVGKTLTPEQVQKGLEYVLLRKDLELFAPGKELRVRVQVDFYPNEVADTKKTFTLARYTLVTAGMKATLEFLNAPYRVAPLGRLKSIKFKLVDENGEFVKEASVYVTIPKSFKYADGTTGRREFKTSWFGELNVSGVAGPDAPGTAYTITAEYDGNVISAKLDVTARGKIGTVDAAVKSLIEISPDGTRLYLYEEPGSNRVSIVDTTTFEIIGRHERDGAYGRIIASSDGENIYIGSANHSVIRVEGWQKVATYTTPEAGYGVLSLDGAYGYYVGTNRVYVVDNSNFKIKEVVPVSYSWWWDGMAISDRYLYIVGYAANSVPSLVNVHVFDTLTNKVLRSGPVIKYSDRFAIFVGPGDKLLYVFSRSKIMVFDSLSLAEVRSVDLVNTVLYSSVLSSDGRLIYFINEKLKISAMDAESLRVIKDFDVVGSPSTLKLSHDNSRLYYSCSDKLGVTVIQVE
jgi:hypothetical protein